MGNGMGKVQDGLAPFVWAKGVRSFHHVHVYIYIYMFFLPSSTPGKHLLKYSDINLFCDDPNLRTFPAPSRLVNIGSNIWVRVFPRQNLIYLFSFYSFNSLPEKS